MAFTWKDKQDMWKGEGIYFLTFNVKNRARLLGTLRRLDAPASAAAAAAAAAPATATTAPTAAAAAAPAAAPPSPIAPSITAQLNCASPHAASPHAASPHIAAVDGTALGNAVYRLFNGLQSKYEGFHVIAKQIMPNHFHAVCWCKEGFGDESIKMVARSFAQACSKEARRLYQLQQTERAQQLARFNRANTNGAALNAATATAAATTAEATAATATAALNAATAAPTAPSITAQFDCASPYDCGNGATTLFETPFIRTLAHPGQLGRMIAYTHNNPDNLQRVTDNPDLYTIHRRQSIAGLLFDTMGKARILDYPDRHVVALSRSLTPEQIDAEVRKALRLAESGTVTYCAAINTAEKTVAKAIREAGYPLVVMMLEGFPPEGSEAARYFHPGGAYHQACGDGRLVLLAPLPVCYTAPHLIDLTERELSRKAEEKGRRYHGIPHSSTRWRMIAGNMMLRTIADDQ